MKQIKILYYCVLNTLFSCTAACFAAALPTIGDNLDSILPSKNNQLLFRVNIDPVYNYSLNYDGSLHLFCSNELCEIDIQMGTEITIIYNFSEPIIDNKKIK